MDEGNGSFTPESVASRRGGNHHLHSTLSRGKLSRLPLHRSRRQIDAIRLMGDEKEGRTVYGWRKAVICVAVKSHGPSTVTTRAICDWSNPRLVRGPERARSTSRGS